MTTTFTVFNVVVASPTDVQGERDTLARVIDQINSDTAHAAAFHLQLIRWEADTHPGFHTLGAQGLIDEILEIESADLLIGVFWHRIGTPTADGVTGTEHEFQKAYRSWLQTRQPQIMIYFNQSSVPSSVDLEQLRRLRAFRSSFPTEGLWWPYTGESGFSDLVNSHLRRFLIRRISPKPLPHPSLAHEDFHRRQEAFKPGPDAEAEPERKKIWLDLEHMEERVERCLQSREFCEIRSKLGGSLASQFIRLLVVDQLANAERYLKSCSLPPIEVMHLMRVSAEAMEHVRFTTKAGASGTRTPR